MDFLNTFLQLRNQLWINFFTSVVHQDIDLSIDVQDLLHLAWEAVEIDEVERQHYRRVGRMCL